MIGLSNIDLFTGSTSILSFLFKLPFLQHEIFQNLMVGRPCSVANSGQSLVIADHLGLLVCQNR